MVPLTRRHVLHGAIALGSLLAGCNDRTTPSTVETQDTEVQVLRDPEHVTLRGSNESPIVELSPPEETDTGSGNDRQYPREYRGLIASRERAERLSIADVDGAGEARAFVSETDFSTETLGIEPSFVGECYRRELCHVIWSEIEYQPWFLETYRDAQVACSEDVDDDLATLFRIPATLDPETTERNGTGVSRNGCRDPPPVPRGGGGE